MGIRAELGARMKAIFIGRTELDPKPRLREQFSRIRDNTPGFIEETTNGLIVSGFLAEEARLRGDTEQERLADQASRTLPSQR